MVALNKLVVLMMGVLPQIAVAASYTPTRGTAERAAIMDSIREGMHSDSIFVVDHLRVIRDGSSKVAFAQVHPSSRNGENPFAGWVLLSTSELGEWVAHWGVSYGGLDACATLKVAYTSAVSVANHATTNMDFFSPQFLHERLAIVGRGNQRVCKGEVVINDQN